MKKSMELLEGKIKFVDGINEAIKGQFAGVESVKYEIVEYPDGYREEYLVATYRGGTIQARNCTGNSHEAIFEEVANMLYTSQKYGLDTKMYKEAKGQC